MDWKAHLALCRAVSNASVVMCVRRADGTTNEMTSEERMLLYANSWYKWILKDVDISTIVPTFVCELCCKKERVSIAVVINGECRNDNKHCRCAEPVCVWCVLQHAFRYREGHEEPRCWLPNCGRVFEEEDLTCVPTIT